MRALELADKALADPSMDGGSDEEGGDDVELEALMSKFARATASKDPKAMAAVFRQAMEACAAE